MALNVFSDQFLSPVYVGWVQGFMDDQRQEVKDLLGDGVRLDHPRRVFERIADDLTVSENNHWLD